MRVMTVELEGHVSGVENCQFSFVCLRDGEKYWFQFARFFFFFFRSSINTIH